MQAALGPAPSSWAFSRHPLPRHQSPTRPRTAPPEPSPPPCAASHQGPEPDSRGFDFYNCLPTRLKLKLLWVTGHPGAATTTHHRPGGSQQQEIDLDRPLTVWGRTSEMGRGGGCGLERGSLLVSPAPEGSWCPSACGHITAVPAPIFMWPCVLSSPSKDTSHWIRSHAKSRIIPSQDP